MNPKRIATTLFALASMLALNGCADGSALVVGETRQAIEDWESVVILTEMPEDAQHIAIVKASSDAGFTQQQSLDFAVEELKRQAAKVGANAVVLGSRSTESEVVGVTVYGGGTVVGTNEVEVVQGTAIYVKR